MEEERRERGREGGRRERGKEEERRQGREKGRRTKQGDSKMYK